jgi:hypothetical protein
VLSSLCRFIKKSLVNHYRDVNQNIATLKKSSQHEDKIHTLELFFNQIQDALNLYTIDILNLSFKKQVIEINASNYKQRLEIIEQKAHGTKADTFLNEFIEFAEDKYLKQIDVDKQSMTLGLKLLEDNINTTHSRLQVEKAKQDRLFQKAIILIGTGWVVATATVDVIQPGQWKGELISSYIEKKGNFTENSDIPSNIASSIYSLGVALIVIMLMLILNRFIPLLDVTRRSRYK